MATMGIKLMIKLHLMPTPEQKSKLENLLVNAKLGYMYYRRRLLESFANGELWDDPLKREALVSEVHSTLSLASNTSLEYFIFKEVLNITFWDLSQEDLKNCTLGSLNNLVMPLQLCSINWEDQELYVEGLGVLDFSNNDTIDIDNVSSLIFTVTGNDIFNGSWEAIVF
jgi:hypothetical protein